MKDFAKSIVCNTKAGNSNKAEIIEKKKKEGVTLKVDNGQKLEFSDGSTYVKTSFSDDYREAHNYMLTKKAGNTKVGNGIKEDMKRAHPNDSRVDGVKTSATYEAIVKQPWRVYDILGVNDSKIREYAFDLIVRKYGINYASIYYAWLHNGYKLSDHKGPINEAGAERDFEKLGITVYNTRTGNSKVGNALNWDENLVGKFVWVKDKGQEWKVYVMQDKGDKVYIRDDEDGSQGWVSKTRITGKVGNSKTGNDTPWEYAHRKPKVINEDKTGAEEFFKQLSDDVKEREKKDDADIEKVGNAKDKNGKELRVGDIVLVWTSAGERAGKVKAISGDRITVAIRNEGDWSTPGKLADKVSNSKVGNANLETSVEKGKLGLWNWYVHKDGTIVSGGTSSTEANAKEMARKALEKEKAGNKVGNIKFASDYYDIKQESNGKFYICVNGGAKTYGPMNTEEEAKSELQRILSQRNKTGNSTWEEPRRMPFQPKALRYAYEQAKKKGLSGQKLEAEMLRIAKTTPYEAAATESEMRKDVSEWVLHNGKPEDFVNNKRTGNEASDDKFAYVMREFDEGKLKTPDGKVVTDPAQAKAIAYSESKKTENGLARARKAMNKGITMWKGNDSAYIKEDGTVSYLENNSFETDKDKFESQESAIKELSKQGYVKK